MRITRSVIVTGIVLFALFFVLRSAEASPSRNIHSNDQAGHPFTSAEPFGILPAAPEAPDAEADLSISILDYPDPVSVNSSLTYTVTVINNTTLVTATNVVMTDTLPVSVSYVSATLPQGGSCAGTVRVVCNLGNIKGGSNSNVVIKVTPLTPGTTITNNALVKASETDPNTTNNSALPVNTTVKPLANLSLGLKVSTTSPVIGGTLAYTVTVTNAGPNQATGVAVRDLLPSGYSYVSNVPSQGTYNSTTGDWTEITLLSGASAQLRLNATLLASGIYSNYAQVMASGADDPNSIPGNNSTTEDDDDTLVTIPIVGADLSLTMTGAPNPVQSGSNLVYSLIATNLGTVNANTVVLTDTLPAGVTYVPPSTGSGWTCVAITGGRVRCTRTRINNGASNPLTLTVLVGSGTTGTLINSAVVNAITADPQPVNNAATATTTVTSSANLGVTLTDGPDPVSPGTNLTYTVTVSNVGPSDAANVVFTDTLSTGVTYQSFTGTGWTCTLTGVLLRCTSAASLLPSTNSRVVILTRVNPATPPGTLANSVLVQSSTPDPLSANNTAATTTTVRIMADLRVNKIDSVDPVAPGTNMAYTIIITNAGPSDATGVKITDTLPAGVSYLLHVPPTEWTCTLLGSEVRCARAAAIPANTVLQLGIGVSVNLSASGVLNNVVRVGAATYDPVSANNSDTETTTVISHSDLSLTKVESSEPVIAGTNLTYTLTVSNAGPSNAASLVVTDTLPANVTYQSFGGTTGWTCTLLTSNRLRCTRSSLTFNTSARIIVLTKVNSSAAGSLSNTAVVRSASIDDDSTNNTATIATAIIARADMSVTKTDSADPVAELQPLIYRVVVKNNGPSDAAGVSLNELIPSEVTFGSAVPVPQGTCTGSGPVTCSLGALGVGKSITVTVTTTAKAVANVPKMISNTATVNTTTTDPNSANNTQTITTQVLPAADLKLNLESALAQVNTGSPLTYTLWITNTGPSIANNVVITDTLPAELTFKSSTRTPAVTSPKVVWNLGNIAKNQSVSFTLVVNVKSPTQSLVNTAVARSSIWDVVPANSQDQASVKAVDNVAPTATWELPVHFGQKYQASFQTTRLEVLATDNVAVSYVRFYRWDAEKLIIVEIGNDYTAETCQFNPALKCYQWDLYTGVLNPKWNEIRARAYDGSDNGTLDPNPNYFWLYRFDYNVYLPFARR
jgi:large repetitive protein